MLIQFVQSEISHDKSQIDISLTVCTVIDMINHYDRCINHLGDTDTHQYVQSRDMINHCDRCINHLGDTDTHQYVQSET